MCSDSAYTYSVSPYNFRSYVVVVASVVATNPVRGGKQETSEMSLDPANDYLTFCVASITPCT